ncbi:MAG: protein adenylyltransferase SelO family protein, partial [Acetobacteraceae bacterium]
QAELVAQWMSLGFIHGVMNTDNMSIAGETIDYGPCAFMDSYDPATVYSSIDHNGRYAYANQPLIAQWNLARLAETLLALLSDNERIALEKANDAIAAFPARFEIAFLTCFRRKVGLLGAQPDDLPLVHDLLERMAGNAADFTLTFRRLCDAAASPDNDAAVRVLFTDPSSFDAWATRWRQRLAHEGTTASARRAAMRAANPAFIARNHRVEEAILAAVGNGDLTPFEQLLMVLAKPFEDHPAFGRYADPPRPDEIVRQTFCGT